MSSSFPISCLFCFFSFEHWNHLELNPSESILFAKCRNPVDERRIWFRDKVEPRSATKGSTKEFEPQWQVTTMRGRPEVLLWNRRTPLSADEQNHVYTRHYGIKQTKRRQPFRRTLCINILYGTKDRRGEKERERETSSRGQHWLIVDDMDHNGFLESGCKK